MPDMVLDMVHSSEQNRPSAFLELIFYEGTDGEQNNKNVFLLMIRANNKEEVGQSSVNIVESLDGIASESLLEGVTFENEDFK